MAVGAQYQLHPSKIDGAFLICVQVACRKEPIYRDPTTGFPRGDYDIYPSSCVRNLGAWFDNKLSMSTHVTKICNGAFYHLHNIRRIKRYLSRDSLLTLIDAFITSRLDYCNGLLYGLPNSQIVKFQRVQNAAARLVLSLRADVSKYRPEVYKSEKSKILKKIHKVALGKLLT